MTKLFEKYELFKGNLKQKKLEPKEYQKMVKNGWIRMKGENGRKVKNRKRETGHLLRFSFIKKL